MQGLEFLNTLKQWNGQGDFSPYNITKVMEFLGNPQDRIPSIHVAGTNGKGSVCVALASILGVSGRKVGLNVSPHLFRVNERIVIDGLSIEDDLLNDAALELKYSLEQLQITLTYHEALTAAAFLVFSSLKLDWIVIEVGLGGRLDASNVLSCPEACVITSIGLDHQDVLGSTRLEISREKAGIIKRGSRLFCGKINSESLVVIDQAADLLSVPKWHWGEDYMAELLPRKNSDGYIMRYHDLRKNSEFLVHPALKGSFQRDNMALAIGVATALGFSEAACTRGVEKVYWPARFEKVPIDESFVIFDCAHNSDGFQALVESLDFEGLRDLRVGFGCLESKNWREMIQLLLPYVREWNLLSPQSTRAVPNKTVSDFLLDLGVKAVDYGSRYDSFLKDHLRHEPLLVAGSMYMVGGVRALLVKEEKVLWCRKLS